MITTDETYCVYMHTFPNGMKYVGITEYGDSPNERWKNGFGYAKNVEMFYDIVKYGWDNIKHEIILSGVTKSEAIYTEKYLIRWYKIHKLSYNIIIV